MKEAASRPQVFVQVVEDALAWLLGSLEGRMSAAGWGQRLPEQEGCPPAPGIAEIFLLRRHHGTDVKTTNNP